MGSAPSWSSFSQNTDSSDLSSEPTRLLYREHSGPVENECTELTQELNEVLGQIYREFNGDFNKRMDRRLRDDPLGEVQQYNMLVQKSHQQNYQKKVEQGILWDLSECLLKTIRNNAKIFVKQLRDSINKVSDPHLRLVLLNDAYHVTLNAAEEVSKITISLFQGDKKACRKLNLKYFNDVICDGLKSTVTSVEDKCELHTQISKAMSLVRDLGQNIEELTRHANITYGFSCSDFDTRSLSTEAETVDENPINSHTIDELVNFIEPPIKKRKRRKRKPKSQARTASNSSSPSRPTDDDIEVNRLKLCLAERKPAEHKVKPNLAADWLQSLSLR